MNYISIGAPNKKPEKPVDPKPTPTPNPNDSDSSPVTAIVIIILLLVIVGVIGFIIYKRRKENAAKRWGEAAKFGENKALVEEEEDEDREARETIPKGIN